MNILSNRCPDCADGTLVEETYSKSVRRGRRSFQVEGLKRFKCNVCASLVVARGQISENNRLIDEASNQEVAMCVSASELKVLRARHGFTQKAASHWFGAGDSAFSKWESGQCSMSAPTALLIRCALDIPEVMTYLISLQSNELPQANSLPAQSDYKLIIQSTGLIGTYRVRSIVRDVNVTAHVTGRTVTDLIAQYEPNEEVGRDWYDFEAVAHGNETQSVSSFGSFH